MTQGFPGLRGAIARLVATMAVTARAGTELTVAAFPRFAKRASRPKGRTQGRGFALALVRR